MRRISPILLLMAVASTAVAQTPTQTIRGTVIDAVTGAPVAGATVRIVGSSSGAITSARGEFTVGSIAVGRYSIEAGSVGYQTTRIPEVLVSAAKEVVLEIRLTEQVHTSGQVVVRSHVDKSTPVNTMSGVSSRMFSVEEASRYAGGFDDPARLASSFAGVATSLGNNGIVVRGNAPASLLWRLEGVEIPNPNHFADLQTFGGGGLTALSGQMLANSDFSTGAFPAEYTNGLSGVFDLRLRNGNPERHEHSVGVGVIGIDATAEGPIVSGSRASYLVNYRYSTLTLLEPLLPEDADGTEYQDLAFKLNIPTPRTGAFSFWGLGLADRSGATAVADSALRVYDADRQTQDARQSMWAGGLSHRILLGESSSLRSGLALAGSRIELSTDELAADGAPIPRDRVDGTMVNAVASIQLESYPTDGHINRTGATVTRIGYDLAISRANASAGTPEVVVDEDRSSLLASIHSSSKITIGEAVEATLGVASQWFSLNRHLTVEPRAALRIEIDPSQSISLGYGLHSRLPRLPYFLARTSATDPDERANTELAFAKAHHLVLSYDLMPADDLHLRIEPYLQYQYDIAVTPGGSGSTLNGSHDWFVADSLASLGLGRNRGIDITLERFLSDGYYYLVSGSLSEAEYMGGDGIWRRSRFDNRFVVNLLAGREWQIGSSDQNTLTISGRLTLQGGNRITPHDPVATAAARRVIVDESRAFEESLPAMLLAHLAIGYRMNHASHAWRIGLDMINATGAAEKLGYRFNERTGMVEMEEESIVVPNLNVRVEF